MDDRTFKPAGAAIAALVAGLAPTAHAMPAQPSKEIAAREMIAAAAAKFKPAQPFAPAHVPPRANADVPFGQQLDLPFRE